MYFDILLDSEQSDKCINFTMCVSKDFLTFRVVGC